MELMLEEMFKGLDPETHAKADIKTWADLRKKTIMIGGIKDITRIYLERMLVPNGVKPGEYDMVFAGATAARFSALASGSVDATILNAPFNFKARGLGLTRLGAAPDYVKDFPFTGYAVSKSWAAQHRGELAAFLGAYAQGVDWFYDPANKAEAVDLAQKISKVDRAAEPIICGRRAGLLLSAALELGLHLRRPCPVGDHQSLHRRIETLPRRAHAGHRGTRRARRVR